MSLHTQFQLFYTLTPFSSSILIIAKNLLAQPHNLPHNIPWVPNIPGVPVCTDLAHVIPKPCT